MAEIRSTMDLVMERAARMGRATSEELARDEARKKGMHLAAEYLDGKGGSLAEILADQPAGEQMAIRSGMLEALLRNIILPRDDMARQRSEKATRGILELGGGAGDLEAICREMQHIGGQYGQHRQQLRQQLEEQVRMQYEQMLAQQPELARQDIRIDPTLQPKFQEEWSRVKAELDDQYNQVLEQHKDLLRQRLLPA